MVYLPGLFFRGNLCKLFRTLPHPKGNRVGSSWSRRRVRGMWMFVLQYFHCQLLSALQLFLLDSSPHCCLRSKHSKKIVANNHTTWDENVDEVAVIATLVSAPNFDAWQFSSDLTDFVLKRRAAFEIICYRFIQLENELSYRTKKKEEDAMGLPKGPTKAYFCGHLL